MFAGLNGTLVFVTYVVLAAIGGVVYLLLRRRARCSAPTTTGTGAPVQLQRVWVARPDSEINMSAFNRTLRKADKRRSTGASRFISAVSSTASIAGMSQGAHELVESLATLQKGAHTVTPEEARHQIEQATMQAQQHDIDAFAERQQEPPLPTLCADQRADVREEYHGPE